MFQLQFDTFAKLKDTHAVYRLDALIDGNPNWQLLYVGTALLQDVLKLSQPQRVPYAARVLQSAKRGCVTVLSTHDNPMAALAERDAYLKLHPSAGNDPDRHVAERRVGRQPLRRSDGATFGSVTEAARNIGVDPQRISKHLAGVYGYGTVHGYTFERIE